MTTLRDIAAEAGVSPMTVSNVLNGRHDKVSPATIRRIQEIMERCGYVPNAPARALSARNSGIVALVYNTDPLNAAALSNPHDSTFVGEVERRVSRAGRYLMIHAAEAAVRTAAKLRTWNVDGAIFFGTVGEEVDDLRERCDVPMVFVDNYSDSPRVSIVGIDDRRGGYLAGQHLTAAGHERVAFAGPHLAAKGVVRQRYLGLSEALADAGRVLPPDLVLECGSRFEDGVEIAHRLMAMPDRPTAVFTTADTIAIGVLKGLQTLGVQVPGEVSLIGFDDLPVCRHITPALTTVRQDVAAKAHAAVEMLLRVLDADRSGEGERVVLGVELISRETVAGPLAASPVRFPSAPR